VHYHERLADGTVIGLYDGTGAEGGISESEYWAYHEFVARREHPVTRGHRFRESKVDAPLRAIEHARIRTALISTYRVHPKEHFADGVAFPKTWEAHEGKIQSHQRFSPPGAIGYFFGLTVDAAIDEASHYARRNLEDNPDPAKLLLVHRTYYTDLLYLAPVLPAVWEYLDLPEMPLWEMYIAVMNRETANEIADSIGAWARNADFKGIVYPSARYGQNVAVPEGADAGDRFPLLNFVELGSHLCEQGVAALWTLNALIGGVARKPPLRPPPIVYSEPNLVVFDEAMVAGLDRPVFYATYELRDAGVVRDSDERAGLKHEIEYAYDEGEITLFVDGPKYRYVLQAPR
jgi:RES domain